MFGASIPREREITLLPEHLPALIAPPKAFHLEPIQQAALRSMDRPDHRPVLIIGGPGCGKTTVALKAAVWEILSGGSVLFVSPTNTLTDAACQTFIKSFKHHLGSPSYLLSSWAQKKFKGFKTFQKGVTKGPKGSERVREGPKRNSKGSKRFQKGPKGSKSP